MSTSGKNAGSTQNQQVRGRPFAPGNRGRPKGARNRSTLAVEQMLDGEAEALARKAIEMALDGDGPAMKLCLDRLLSPRRDRAITFALPVIESAADLPRATEAMLQAVASGEITPSEAADIGKAVSAHIEAVTAAEMAQRLARLEEAGA
ncbi:DUF5681 domain-containing protein [Methylobacterium longum]|uniref:DUF5681 domain-containing protein n=1 Tax=Methylobacterium longum TaxID=767694 RepID=A0ABT8ATB2_9HYPH|nr:DUF5681 domain-containing protein [Methylobacterium longum]MDN3573078.1 hypothetical protein [Methylobacterium longum]GJE12113.1 hypothetical protein FOHLNKBM_3159 [Methylobacterium longum]